MRSRVYRNPLPDKEGEPLRNQYDGNAAFAGKPSREGGFLWNSDGNAQFAGTPDKEFGLAVAETSGREELPLVAFVIRADLPLRLRGPAFIPRGFVLAPPEINRNFLERGCAARVVIISWRGEERERKRAIRSVR